MRIISLLIVSLFLAACGSDAALKQPEPKTAQDAKAYCEARGPMGSYEFDSCYRNRPAVQAAQRQARTQTLAIIYDNRSPAAGGQSRPVE